MVFMVCLETNLIKKSIVALVVSFGYANMAERGWFTGCRSINT